MPRLGWHRSFGRWNPGLITDKDVINNLTTIQEHVNVQVHSYEVSEGLLARHRSEPIRDLKYPGPAVLV